MEKGEGDLSLFSVFAGVTLHSTVLTTTDEAKLGFSQTFGGIEALIVFGPNKLIVAVLAN